MNKLSNAYINKVKTLFPIMGKSERKYLKTMKINIDDFLADRPDSDLDDLYQEFGTPTDVVNAYYTSVDTNNIIKRIRISKYIKTFILTLIICSLSLTIWKLHVSYETQKTFIEEKIFSEETTMD